MKRAAFDYILKTVQQTNILPVTSRCTTGCIFCSHKNNPVNIDVYSLPELTFEEIKDICQFLDKNKKIVIGESASRIIEGEPFLREDILDILHYIRDIFPTTLVEITTNGTYLTQELINELKDIEPLELNLSLNSSTCEGRKLLHRDKNFEGAIKSVEYLSTSGIKYHGSIVAMPDVVGYQDIIDTISYLCIHNARTVRVFVPGFSTLSGYDVDFYSIRKKLHEISDSAYEAYGIPVLIEPPEIRDLDAVVCGVIKGSPANEAGILKDDLIRSIDGYEPLTRVDAYSVLYRKANPEVVVDRKGEHIHIHLNKKSNTSSGAVFYYDIHPDVIYDIGNTAKSGRSQNPMLITSYLAYPVIKLGIDKLLDMDISICKVSNNWFGGSIMCAGLLTVSDIIEEISRCTLDKKPDMILLPPTPFDIYGKDLSGHYFYEIEDATGIKTVIVE